MNFISTKLIKSLRSQNTIIQFSPPRSGSTLVFNILREVFPEKKIIKTHKYKKRYLLRPVVTTYRHPLDCIASCLQCYEKNISSEMINEHIKIFEENGIWKLLEIKDHKNVLLLKYETIKDNYEIIFDKIEEFFDIHIPPEKRKQITKRYNINAVEKLIGSKDSFKEFDPVTNLHGKHISKFKGESYYQKFFNKNQIELMNKEYRNFLKTFGYSDR